MGRVWPLSFVLLVSRSQPWINHWNFPTLLWFFVPRQVKPRLQLPGIYYSANSFPFSFVLQLCFFCTHKDHVMAFTVNLCFHTLLTKQWPLCHLAVYHLSLGPLPLRLMGWFNTLHLLHLTPYSNKSSFITSHVYFWSPQLAVNTITPLVYSRVRSTTWVCIYKCVHGIHPFALAQLEF